MSVASSSSGASSCNRGPEDDLLLRQVRLGQLHLRQNRRALLSAVASSPPVPKSCEARTVDIHALVEGQQVQIWSKSQQRWLNGEVVQKTDRDSGVIFVLVRYGDPAREKWFNAAMVAKSVRPAPPEPAAEMAWVEPDVLTTKFPHPELGALDDEVGERWLFHGTGGAGLVGITDDDFCLDLSGSNAGEFFGKGVYLAESCAKADEYSRNNAPGSADEVLNEHPDWYGLLVCRTTLGRVIVHTEQAVDVDSLMADVKRGRFDSVCGDRWLARG